MGCGKRGIEGGGAIVKEAEQDRERCNIPITKESTTRSVREAVCEIILVEEADPFICDCNPRVKRVIL